MGVSLIAELAFRRGLDERRLRPLLATTRLVDIHRHTATAQARERFTARGGTRRPMGGPDAIGDQMAASTFDWAVFAPLDLDVSRLIADTTDGYAPGLAAIVAFCRPSQTSERTGQCDRAAGGRGATDAHLDRARVGRVPSRAAADSDRGSRRASKTPSRGRAYPLARRRSPSDRDYRI